MRWPIPQVNDIHLSLEHCWSEHSSSVCVTCSHPLIFVLTLLTLSPATPCNYLAVDVYTSWLSRALVFAAAYSLCHSGPVNDDCSVVCSELINCCRSQSSLFGSVVCKLALSTDHAENAKLEHNVAVIFDHADFSAQNIAYGLSTECMKHRAGDGRTIIIIIICNSYSPVDRNLWQ